MTSGLVAGEPERLGTVGRLADHHEVRIGGEHAAQPSLTTGWSSAMSSLIGAVGPPSGRSCAGQGSHGRHAGRDRGAPPGSDSTCSVPDRPSIRCRIATAEAFVIGQAPGIEPDAVIADVKRDLVFHVGEGQPTRPAFACLATFASASWAARSSPNSVSG